jgi:hypothetical protein
MIWTRHIAWREKFLKKLSQKGRSCLGILRWDRKIILKWILMRRSAWCFGESIENSEVKNGFSIFCGGKKIKNRRNWFAYFWSKFVDNLNATHNKRQRLQPDFETSQATENICARFKKCLVLIIKLYKTNIAVNNFTMKERKFRLLHILELKGFSWYVILLKISAVLNKIISSFSEFRDRLRFLIRGRSWADRDDDNVLAEEAILTMAEIRVAVS